MSEVKYTKEQMKAIAKIKDCWDERDSYLVPEICDSSSFIKDFHAFTHKRIELKSTNEWRWNQSIGNVTFELNSELEVELNKLNSRKKSTNSPNAQKIPKMKVWLYQIFNKNDLSRRVMINFIWCEDGVSPHSIFNPADIRIEDLSFLKSFTSQDIANAFGW